MYTFMYFNMQTYIYIVVCYILDFHLSGRLTPSLCISHPTKFDMYEIIMNPSDEWKTYCLIKSAPHFGKKIIHSSYNTLEKKDLKKVYHSGCG